MSQLLKISHDRLLPVFALAVLAVSCVWGWRQQMDVRRLRALPVAPQLTGSRYEPASLRRPESELVVWPNAPAQSHGSDWLYEVFTPPVIYYSPTSRSFTVTPPLQPAAHGTPFGLELIAVKPELYRLQLAGYFGGPDDYLAAFVSPNQPETLFARKGGRFDALGLTLTSFEVKKILVEHQDAWPVYDVAALAVLQDDKTGAVVVLDSRERKFTATPLAVLKLLKGDGQPRELREGDRFSDDTSNYRIERIQLDPPEVVVARQTTGLPQPETRVLRPAGHGGGQVAVISGKPFREGPAGGLAANGN